jgi:thiamine transport system permease protein
MRPTPGRRLRRGFLLAASLVFVLPYFITLVRFQELRWSMGVVTALGDSVLLALLSAIATVAVAAVGILSVRALRGRVQALWKFLLVLPAGVSILALAWGLWTAYPRVFRLSGAGIEVLVLLQLAVFLPLVVRSGIVHLRGVQESLLESARSLGAGPWRAFVAVEWPRWRPWMWTMLAWVAGGSVAEIAALSLFRVDGFEPLPLLVLRELGRYGFSQGEALSGLLLLVAFVLSFGSSAWSVKRT